MKFVEIEKAGKVAVLRINRPQALNALNQEVLLELRSAFISLENISVAILTGAGDKAFVAGADIQSMSKMDPMQARAFVEIGQGTMQTIESAPLLTIAAVNGFALGGGLELALTCDLIYAAKTAKLGLPETNLGLIPGFGGTVNLIHRVGFHRAMEMILTGKMVYAEEALSMGLILEAIEPAQLLPKVKDIAEKLSKKGILSLLAAKRCLRQMISSDRERAFLLERETFASLFASEEPREGMAAFLEKREPKFPNPSL